MQRANLFVQVVDHSPLLFQLYLSTFEWLCVQSGLFDQLLIIILKLRKLHLRFLDLFLALFNLALVFLENGGASVAEDHIKDIDSIFWLLR